MYKKILVPLDGSDLAECVLPHVQSIAEGCKAPEVVFIRVVEPFRSPVTGEGYYLTDENVKRINNESKSRAKDYLDQVVKKVKIEGAKITAVTMSGKAAEKIADYAVKNNVDLIVIATHGRSGVSRWVWGSVAEKILRSSCAPVFIVRAPGCVPGI